MGWSQRDGAMFLAYVTGNAYALVVWSRRGHSCITISTRVLYLALSELSWSNSLQSHRLFPMRPLCLWDFPGKNTIIELPSPPPGDFFRHKDQAHISCVSCTAGRLPWEVINSDWDLCRSPRSGIRNSQCFKKLLINYLHKEDQKSQYRNHQDHFQELGFHLKVLSKKGSWHF